MKKSRRFIAVLLTVIVLTGIFAAGSTVFAVEEEGTVGNWINMIMEMIDFPRLMITVRNSIAVLKPMFQNLIANLLSIFGA